jgi:hypothetical protein
MVLCSDCSTRSSDLDPAWHGHKKGRIEVQHAFSIRHFQIKMFIFQLKISSLFGQKNSGLGPQKSLAWKHKKVWIWIQHEPGYGISIKPESEYIKSKSKYRKGLNLEPHTLTGYPLGRMSRS